jgi:hypothetical protein
MAQVRVMAFDVSRDKVEESEAEMSQWVSAGWQIVGTNFHSYFTSHHLWVTFVKS